MAFPGPNTFRNLRKIAVEKGTVPNGFADQLVPGSVPTVGQAYRDDAEAAFPPPAAAKRDPEVQPKPYKVG